MRDEGIGAEVWSYIYNIFTMSRVSVLEDVDGGK